MGTAHVIKLREDAHIGGVIATKNRLEIED